MLLRPAIADDLQKRRPLQSGPGGSPIKIPQPPSTPAPPAAAPPPPAPPAALPPPAITGTLGDIAKKRMGPAQEAMAKSPSNLMPRAPSITARDPSTPVGPLTAKAPGGLRGPVGAVAPQAPGGPTAAIASKPLLPPPALGNADQGFMGPQQGAPPAAPAGPPTPEPAIADRLRKTTGGFSAFLDDQIGAAGFRKSGMDRKSGWIVQSGKYKGKSRDEASAELRKQYAAFSPEQRAKYEGLARFDDVGDLSPTNQTQPSAPPAAPQGTAFNKGLSMEEDAPTAGSIFDDDEDDQP